jgi:hypothetical protein
MMEIHSRLRPELTVEPLTVLIASCVEKAATENPFE